MLAGVLMSQNSRPSGVQPFIPIGVVEVPVSIDKVLDWIGANVRFGNLRTSTSKSGIDEELTVAAREDSDISTSTHENAYVPAQPLDGDRGPCGFVPRFPHETRRGDNFCSGEECSRNEQPRSSKASG
jgi:hypothetical protein